MVNKGGADHPEYIGYLDSVRGIAALWVMLYHYLNHRFHEHSMAKLASFLINGETAIFLFVLSGFVLSYKYIVLGQPLDIRRFYVQRFLRFWPAFFIAVLLNALYQYRHELTGANLLQQFAFNETHFWEEALLLKYVPGHHTNPIYYVPGWALVIILSMSFLVPFFVALAQRNVKLLLWLLLATFLIGNNVGPKYVYHVHFILGALISCYFIRINDGWLKQQKWYRFRYLMLGLAVVLFSFRQLNRINKVTIFGAEYKYWMHDYLGLDFSHYSAIASAVFLVAIIASKGLHRLLNSAILRFIGTISYCIYLMHWVVVVAIFDYWEFIVVLFPNTITAVIVMMMVCTAVSIALATALHYWVELPSIRFSKRFAARLRPSVVINSTVVGDSKSVRLERDGQ